MKKLFYSLAFIALISILTSCTPKPEELILGDWILEDAEVLNLDEFVQNSIDMQKKAIDEQIAPMQAELDTSENEKPILKAKVEVLIQSKEELSAEKLKEQIQASVDEMKGVYKLTFTEDGKVTSDGTSYDWKISEDGKTLTRTMGDESLEIEILELTSTKFSMAFENPKGDDVLKWKWSFNKAESGATETTDEETDQTEEDTTE